MSASSNTSSNYTFECLGVVHLDMKGAPLKLAFFRKLFPYLKSLGATSVMIEWEDTFPYVEELAPIGSLSQASLHAGAPYDPYEARQIVNLAIQTGLEVFPSVQTFGQVDFLLKHSEWSHLRESRVFPSSLCPSHPEVLQLVAALIEQVIHFHLPKYIHIGADQVIHIGLCPQCSYRAQTNPYGIAGVYMEHLKAVALYIHRHHPNMVVLIWDTVIRELDDEILAYYDLGVNVEPIIRTIEAINTRPIENDVWEKYGRFFKNVWCATSFKGATGSCQIMPLLSYHISNVEYWLMEIVNHASHYVNIRGIMLCGNARYDHFATICELLPVALPCLFICMRSLTTGRFNYAIYNDACRTLGFANTLMPLYLDAPTRPIVIAHTLRFPGWQVYTAMEWFLNLRYEYGKFVSSELIQTWFNPWHVLHYNTNPVQVHAILSRVCALLNDALALVTFVLTHFPRYFHQGAVEEILGTLFMPIKNHLEKIKIDCVQQLQFSDSLAIEAGPSWNN